MVFKIDESADVYQVRDDERNIILKRIGTAGRGIDVFELYWEGYVTKFSAFAKGSDVKKHIPYKLDWTVDTLHIPAPLKGRAEELSKIIEEAFGSYGYRPAHNWNGQVSVEFQPNLLG